MMTNILINLQVVSTDNDEMYYWMFKIFNRGRKGSPVFKRKERISNVRYGNVV